MDNLIEFACQHAYLAPFVIIAMLFLGIILPISEELVFICSGALVSLCLPTKYVLFATVSFFGAWITGWTVFWIGRELGPKLTQFSIFRHLLNPKYLKKMDQYFQRYGFLTFIVGRFIPGGIRNAMIASAGMSGMPFHKYLIYDGISVFLSANVFFYLGYLVGANFEHLHRFVKEYEHVTFLALLGIFLAGILGVGYYFYRHET